MPQSPLMDAAQAKELYVQKLKRFETQNIAQQSKIRESRISKLNSLLNSKKKDSDVSGNNVKELLMGVLQDPDSSESEVLCDEAEDCLNEKTCRIMRDCKN